MMKHSALRCKRQPTRAWAPSHNPRLPGAETPLKALYHDGVGGLK
jgi:hypothetical protein